MNRASILIATIGVAARSTDGFGRSDEARDLQQKVAQPQETRSGKEFCLDHRIHGALVDFAKGSGVISDVVQGRAHAASAFMRLVPADLPFPEVWVSEKGETRFEWAERPDQLLDISFLDDGVVHFAALFGNDRTYGELRIAGSIPSVLLAYLQMLAKRPHGRT
jgi:hypothetical protein